MKKNFLFGLLALMLAGAGFGGVSMADDNVAKIGDGECDTQGTSCYTALDAAIQAAGDGATVTLLADGTIASNIVLTKDLTINVNGKKINTEGATNSIFQITNSKTLTIDGTTEGSAVYGRINVGIATNNNGNVVLSGGTYGVGDGQTVLHINGTCLDSDVTIKDATITSANDNGIQLNGAGTFVIDNTTIGGGTSIYIKAGELTLTNSTIKGTLDPVNYSYNGNGANPTGDGIVVDSCEYPGGEPTINIGAGNTISGTKKGIGYYRYDANGDEKLPDASIVATSNDLTLPDGFAWFKMGDEYIVATNDSIAIIDGTHYATLNDAIAAAEDGDTVTMIADGTISSNIILTKDLIVNVNGHKINAEGATNSIFQITNSKTLTIDGTTEGSAVYGRINVGIATNDNGNVVLSGGTYGVGDGQTVLHINGTCLDSDVTIKDATITSANDNGIQLNGAGTFVIDNTTIEGGTSIYIKAGELTLTNSTIKGTLDPVNYSYNGNGANPTGDGIVVDSCEYPGGEPTINIGAGNTISGTKKGIGYYRYDANGDEKLPDASIVATSNDLTLPDGYSWHKEGDQYKVIEGYSVNLLAVSNGSISSNVDVAKKGDEVTLTATPALNYTFSSWTVKDTNGSAITVTDNKFTMPASNVTVSATFTSKPASYSGGGGSPRSSSTTTTKKDDTKKAEETTKDEETKADETKTDESKTEENKVDGNNNDSVAPATFSQEFIDAYNFAYKNGITTMPTINEAQMDQPLTRIAMAKMLSQYAINVLGKTPDTTIEVPNFPDVSEELDAQYNNGVTLAYQLGIMGINVEKFRPNDLVTRAEFGTALSRMLYGLADGEGNEWYKTHLDKLMEEKIITVDTPNLKELRGYVMIMLMRSANRNSQS